MASISERLDGVIKEFNEMIEENGGQPQPYTGGLSIDEHIMHIGKLIDSMPVRSGGESIAEISASESATAAATSAATSASNAAASEAATRAIASTVCTVSVAGTTLVFTQPTT